MIGSLSGVLQQKTPGEVVVDVGGVGYRVLLSLQSFASLPKRGEAVFLLIHTAVREDDITLYGFFEEREKILFQKLIAVTGIGPKLALTILSGISNQDLVSALRREDVLRLMAIPGIGKKTAERIVVELKDKVVGLEGGGKEATPLGPREEVLSALVNLGYSRPTAERTLAQMPREEGVPLERLVREALRILRETRV